MRDPSTFFAQAHRRYGDIFTVRMPRQAPAAFVCTVDLAREVFASDHADGRAGEARGAFLERLVGEHSLLCLDGQEWSRQRRHIGSTLSSSRVAAQHTALLTDIADEHIARWPRGVEFDLHPRMQELSLDVLIRVGMGIREPARVDRLRAVVPALFADWVRYGFLSVVPSTPRSWLERRLMSLPGPVSRFHTALDEVDAILRAEVSERRTRSDRPASADAVSTLAHARDDTGAPLDVGEIRSGLMTQLVAGYETTASALTWVFERVVRHPEVLTALVGADRTYIDAVVHETLSVRPVFIAMPRLLTAPLDLGGYRIPAGWQISPASTVLHGSDTGAGPDEFRPERLLAPDARSPSWVFGGGRRRCTGSALATEEMIVVVERVVRHLRLRPPADRTAEKMRIFNAALVPARGGRVVAEPRPPAPSPTTG